MLKCEVLRGQPPLKLDLNREVFIVGYTHGDTNAFSVIEELRPDVVGLEIDSLTLERLASMPNQWVIQKYGELQRVIDVATRNSKWKVLALDAPPWMVASWCFSEASLGERLRLATAWGLGSAPLYAKFSDVVIRTRSEFFARRIIDKAPANSRTVALVGSSHVDSLIDALGRGGQIQVNAHPTRSFFNTCLFNLVHMRGK